MLYIYQIVTSLAVLTFGTVLDYVVHHLHPMLMVPFDYYPNKIIFGAFWFFVFLNLFGYFTNNPKNLRISVPLAVAVILQTKYFFQGYPILFVVGFLFLHFMMFLPATFWIFKRYGNLIVS